MENDFEDLTYENFRDNRAKKQKPKLMSVWCYACDGALVRNGQKCPNCGNRVGKNLKKERI